MNLITFSDLHIGNKYIDGEVINNLINDIKRLSRPKESIVIFCGDLFHRRVELDTNEARLAIHLLKEIDSLSIPFYLIQGTFSHDYNYINTIEKVEFKNIKFIQTHSESIITNNMGEKLNVLFIPEEYIENQYEYYKDTVYNRKKIYDLVIMHGTFTDILFHNHHMESEVLRKAPKFESKDFSRHILTLSGHIHRHQVIGKKKNIVYVGSYSNMNFGDDVSNNIHSIELDIKNKKFEMTTILNGATHNFTDISINEDNISDMDKIISKLKNKSSREHYRVKMFVNDKLNISILKELKREGFIKNLIIDSEINHLTCDEVKSDNIENYNEIYYGPLENQIQTYIENVYNVKIDTNDIIKMMV